jgi:hypothetical protein
MVVQGIGARKVRVFLCREDVRVEGAGKASRLHALYDWGATVTLVTHAAAVRAGLERKRQTPTAIAGLGGRCTMVNSYYMVPVIDGKDRVRVVKALSWRGPYHDVGGLERNRGHRNETATRVLWKNSPNQQETWGCWSAWTIRVGCPCTWRAAGLRATTCG